MKKSLIFLALSLAANAAFLVTFFVRPAPTESRVTTAPVAEKSAGSAVSESAAAAGLSAADVMALKRSGELMMSGDLHMIVARLRAAGYPPSVIRAIITAQVTDQFGIRRKAVVANQEVVPYWKSSQTFPHDAKAGAELAALSREQTALLKELLGPDAAPSDEWSQLIRKRQYGDLSQEKIDRLQAIMGDYNDLRSQLNADNRGVWLPEDQKKFALLNKEQRADIVKLFTPEELEAYDLRNNGTAHMLRSQLSAFNPTEDEFKLLYHLTAPLNESISARQQEALETGNQDVMRGVEADQKKLQADIDAALGPARAAEYREAIDPNYQSVSRLLTRLDLPSSVAHDVVAVQKDIQQRVQATLQDRSLSAEARTSQLTSLSQEAEMKLTASLGEDGLKAYRSYSGGWLNGIIPRQPKSVTKLPPKQ